MKKINKNLFNKAYYKIKFNKKAPNFQYKINRVLNNITNIFYAFKLLNGLKRINKGVDIFISKINTWNFLNSYLYLLIKKFKLFLLIFNAVAALGVADCLLLNEEGGKDEAESSTHTKRNKNWYELSAILLCSFLEASRLTYFLFKDKTSLEAIKSLNYDDHKGLIISWGIFLFASSYAYFLWKNNVDKEKKSDNDESKDEDINDG